MGGERGETGDGDAGRVSMGWVYEGLSGFGVYVGGMVPRECCGVFTATTVFFSGGK